MCILCDARDIFSGSPDGPADHSGFQYTISRKK